MKDTNQDVKINDYFEEVSPQVRPFLKKALLRQVGVYDYRKLGHASMDTALLDTVGLPSEGFEEIWRDGYVAVIKSTDFGAGVVYNMLTFNHPDVISIEVGDTLDSFDQRKFMMYWDDSDDSRTVPGINITPERGWTDDDIHTLSQLSLKETVTIDNLTQQITITRVR